MKITGTGEGFSSSFFKTLFNSNLSFPDFRRFGALIALTAAIAACSGGAPTGPAGSAAKDSVPPEFKGAVLSYSSGKGTLSLHWPEATDAVTPAAKMAYNVYIGNSPDPGAIVQSSNLKTTVSNKTTASVSDLPPGGTYYCLVKAVDEAGNKSLNTAVSTVIVRAADLVVDAAPKVLEKMNLSVAQTDAASAVLSGPDAASVMANDVVILDNLFGQSLKKVLSAKADGGNTAITLRDVSLGEVVRSGTINSATLMASLTNLPAQKTGAEAPGTFDLRYKDPAGFFEITEYGLADDATKTAKNMAKYNSMAALAPDVTLGYTILFDPELATNVEFGSSKSPNSLGAIRISAKGTLNFNATASFELKGAASHDLTKRILNRSATMKYSIGAIPVVQETFLEVMAHLRLKTDVPLNMFAELSTSKAVDLAFEWNRESGWRLVNGDSFDQRITLNIMSAGQIAGTLELYPIISSRFFKASHSGSYKMPKMDMNANVRIIPPPLEVSVFDSNIHVDSYIAASPKVFGFTVAEWEKDRAQIQNQKLYTPPVVAAAPATGVKVSTGTDVPLDSRVADAGKISKPPAAKTKKPAEAPAPVAGRAASSTASLDFKGLTPDVWATSAAPDRAIMTASGANFKNVKKVTFSLVRVKSGAQAGTYVWTKKGKLRGQPWNAKVILNPDGSLTLKPIITTPGDTTQQTIWTVTLSDGHTTASQRFTVDYTNTAVEPKVASAAPVEVKKAKAPVAPPPAPPKVTAPAEKAKAPVAPAAPVEAPSKVSAASETVGVGAGISNLMGGAIQKPLTLSGTVSTFAGGAGVTGVADGPAAAARFNYINGITTDLTNLYVTDQNSGTIRKIVIATGAVSTLAGSPGATGTTDGTGAAAQFNLPEGITTDGKNLYVADKYNNTIRKIVIATGAVSTLAGSPGTAGAKDGTGTAARFSAPTGLTTDGVNVYVADKGNHAIRKIAIATGAVTTLAGSPGMAGESDGAGSAARLNGPTGVTTDGKNLYVADQYNYAIRKIVIATGAVTTLAGKAKASGAADGAGNAARFTGPTGITTDGANLYVTEYLNHTVRKVVIATGAVTTVAGGEGAAAKFNMPKGITTDGTGIYVVDYANHSIRKIQ